MSNLGKSKTRAHARKEHRSEKHWTSEEDKILTENYPIDSIAELAMKLGRSITAVKQRASNKKLRRKYIMDELQLTETQRAYLAGIIDGDGTITISKGKMDLKPLISISNTSLEGINALNKLLEPLVYDLKLIKRKRRSTSKVVYRFTLSGVSRVYPVLERIEPYLIIKKKRAKLVLDFCKSRCEVGKGMRYTEQEFNIVNEIRTLNMRGVTTRDV